MTTKSGAADGSVPREPKRVLGRGLSALIPSSLRDEQPSLPPAAGQDEARPAGGLRLVPLLAIALNPFQPREEFSPDRLEELTESVRQHGVLQPIVVRPKGTTTFELVAGERRFRAATNAGLKEIPAIVKEVDDRASLAIALIENIQRQELNPVESARAYRRLMAEFGLSQSELALEVGKSQPSIANSVRVLSLPDPVLESLSRGVISEGHAKALLSVEGDSGRIALWRAVVDGGLSVRETERRAAASKRPIPRGIQAAGAKLADVPDPDRERVEDDLSHALGTRVRLKYAGREKGHIEIQFYDLEQLDGLLQALTGKR